MEPQVVMSESETQRTLGNHAARIKHLEDSDKKILDEFRELRGVLARIEGAATRAPPLPPANNDGLALAIMRLAEKPAPQPPSEVVTLMKEIAAALQAKPTPQQTNWLSVIGALAIGAFVMFLIFSVRG